MIPRNCLTRPSRDPEARETYLDLAKNPPSHPAVLTLRSELPKRKIPADDWLPIDPDELKMTSEPKAPGAPAIASGNQLDPGANGPRGRKYREF
jgi:hypothetical protein